MSEIVMAAPRLAAVPRDPFPHGFAVRAYRRGDDATWARIHADTKFYDPLPPGLHKREFGTDEAALVARQLFVIDESDYAVATATAWFNDPSHGVPGGRIHWVAVVPAVQRMGIASALVGAVCDRFAELGETVAYLTTDSENVKAIALYEGLGFRRVG